MDNPNWSMFAHAAVLVHPNSKHPVGTGWQNKSVTPDELATHLAAGGNLGLKCDTYPGVDIDISERSMQRVADRIAAMAHKLIAPAPVRGRADAPSRLLLYRRGGDLPRNPIIEFHDRDGVVSKIELRAGNTQSVVHGVHPQGQRYSCDRQFTPYDLKEITHAQWEAFRKATCDYLGTLGYTILSDGAGGTLTTLTRHALGAPEHLVADPEALVTMIESRPNTHERFPNRNDIVHYLAASKSSLGQAAETYRDRICAWATQYDGPNEFTAEQFDSMWDSIRDSAHGWQYVHDMTVGKPSMGVYLDPAERKKFTGIGIEFLDDVTEPDDFVENLMCTASRSVLFGQSNTGKSMIAVMMCMSVGRGVPFCDRDVERGGTAYFLGEGQRGMRLRIQAYLKRNPEVSAGDILFELVETTGNMLDEKEVNLVVQSAQDIKERLGSLKLVILDTLACAMPGGDENSAQDMTKILKAAGRIVDATGAHVMLIHHGGKDQSKGARGHSSLRAAVDTELTVTRENKDAPICMSVSKQRDLEYTESMWFDLEREQLSIGRRGKPVYGPVLRYRAPPKVVIHLPPFARDLQQLLNDVGGQMAIADWRNRAYIKWKAHNPDLKASTLAQRFANSLAKLETHGIVRVNGEIAAFVKSDFEG